MSTRVKLSKESVNRDRLGEDMSTPESGNGSECDPTQVTQVFHSIIFQDNRVVCTGEDAGELKRAMAAVIPGHSWRYHKYRCCKAWCSPVIA